MNFCKNKTKHKPLTKFAILQQNLFSYEKKVSQVFKFMI